MPLVLTRRVGEIVDIGEEITISVERVRGQSVKLKIYAPDEFRILRRELRLAGCNDCADQEDGGGTA